MSDPALHGSVFASLRLHHVGIVVPDFDAADAYMQMFSHREQHRGYVPEFECWCIFCVAPPGSSTIELIVPTGGPLVKFNRGIGGLHHYALIVEDLDHMRAELMERSIELLHDQHVQGAGDFLCNFIGPSFTRGVVVELVQITGSSAI